MKQLGVSARTIRMADDKYERLKEVARSRNTSVNRLIGEMATLLLAELDAEARFRMRAERGKGKAARRLVVAENNRCHYLQ